MDRLADSIKQQGNLGDATSNVTDEVAKHKIKDSVFTNLFKDRKYLFQLYKALHPEDTNATEGQLTYVTIENILINGLYNDLGFTERRRSWIL